ncbi:hypothetical protein CFP56_032304 [Quercus suber]|uniref:Uncharacterized protein n=1 Tax=Quercus suber TaxID=58331 RepID=A0AAW0JHD1_QUESU
MEWNGSFEFGARHLRQTTQELLLPIEKSLLAPADLFSEVGPVLLKPAKLARELCQHQKSSHANASHRFSGSYKTQMKLKDNSVYHYLRRNLKRFCQVNRRHSLGESKDGIISYGLLTTLISPVA